MGLQGQPWAENACRFVLVLFFVLFNPLIFNQYQYYAKSSVFFLPVVQVGSIMWQTRGKIDAENEIISCKVSGIQRENYSMNILKSRVCEYVCGGW